MKMMMQTYWICFNGKTKKARKGQGNSARDFLRRSGIPVHTDPLASILSYLRLSIDFQRCPSPPRQSDQVMCARVCQKWPHISPPFN